MHKDHAINYSSRPAPKILVFDEDIAVRALIVQGLKSQRNLRVYEVNSVSSTEQRIRDQHFDLIVLGRFRLSTHDASSSFIDHQLSYMAFIQSLKSACDCLVALYSDTTSLKDDQQVDPKTALSKDTWNILIAQISQVNATAESNGYLLYPRPERPSLIPALSQLALTIKKEQDIPSVGPRDNQELEEGQLVLWAGPEDHPLVNEIQRACQSMHQSLVCVDSAQHALRETRRTRFEACFVHTQLSDMAGLSLVRSLRREVGESLPVAYVGVAQEVSDRLEGVHAGVSLYINETAGFDAITQALRHLQNLGTHGVSKVLVIDDDDAMMADMITEELKRGKFQVSCLTSPLRILELLAEIRTDLLVIHAEMKGLGGFELCRTLRAMPEWQTLPIILVGESYSDEVRIAAYRSGADDYVSSASEEGMIKTCVEARLERSRTVQERADRDGLTGLLIRRAFNDALMSQMALARRRGSTVAVCLIDLDHFKSINDTYGHISGDRVLSALGRLLSSSFRVEDLRGRWGGEEFVVAFSDESAESAKAILERARKEFVRFYFDGEHGERFQAAFSAGVACYPQAGETIEDVFKVADRRLYAVKAAGRNNIFADDSVEESEAIKNLEDIQPNLELEKAEIVGESELDDSDLKGNHESEDSRKGQGYHTQLLPPFSDED
ncbi:MAG: hypothetical protein CMH49_06315 [Myxococcales bacterium]|nr:hypothetical protein [Myxococcales bacterium]